MKEDKSTFLKVDNVEPVYRNVFSPFDHTSMTGMNVWIGDNGHFFPCDQIITCDPDATVEYGRRQVVELVKEIQKTLAFCDRNELFGYCTFSDILDHFSYDEICNKLDLWKKEQEKIQVRDEVYSQSYDMRFVVTKIWFPSGGEDPYVNGIKKDGTAIKGLLLCNVKKTGIHVDDLDAYLEV